MSNIKFDNFLFEMRNLNSGVKFTTCGKKDLKGAYIVYCEVKREDVKIPNGYLYYDDVIMNENTSLKVIIIFSR